MKTSIYTIFLALLATLSAQAQTITQTIKGRVIDQQSQVPLPGVNVYVEQNGKKNGSSTDFDGYFRIEDVAAGRVTVFFSFIGYEPIVMRNIELTGSKELVLNVQMRESTQELSEVVVKAKLEKDRTRNERVNVSGRSFSIEESQRFAGALQDVSRMASNFAVVSVVRLPKLRPGWRGMNELKNFIQILLTHNRNYFYYTVFNSIKY